jgi:enoyl-CoA hydratase
VAISATNVQRLVQAVGQPLARDLLLTARVLDADEAEEAGLVQRRAEDAVTEAMALAAEVALLAPISAMAHKAMLAAVATRGALSPTDRARLADHEDSAFTSRDLQEGLAAFAERRPPNFAGQ